MSNLGSDHINVEALPTIPHTLLELIRLFGQPSVEFKLLAEAIRQDPVVTARVFKLANSVFFRQWRKVSNLHQLLVVLGIDTVRQIALLCATEQIFSHFAKELNQPVTALWYRSVLCAHLAEKTAALIGYPSKDEAYLAGLLHRIGQLSLLCSAPDRYLKKIDIVLDLKKTETFERRLFNITSSEIGAAIVQDWQVCPFIADAIEFQTQSADSVIDSTPLVRILLLSRLLCDHEEESVTVTYAATRLFNLNNEILQTIRQQAQQSAHSIIQHLCPQRSGDGNGLSLLEQSLAECNDALRQQVKNRALTNILRMQPSLSDEERASYNRLRSDFHLLFGIEELCFLIKEDSSDRLCGHDDLGTRPELHQVSIQPDNEASLGRRAFQENRIAFSAENRSDGFCVAERQLENLLNSRQLAFIPLRSTTRQFGLLVAALTPAQSTKFSTESSLLEMAAQLATETLTEAQQRRTSQQRDREELQLSLRAKAHEINNPLSIITNYLYLLSQQLEEEKAQQQIEILQEEINRIGILVADLKNLGATPTADLGTIQLNDLILQLKTLMSGSLFKPRQLSLHLDLDSELKPIISYPGHLKQILINLLKNAAEALAPQGEVWVSTRDRIFKNHQQHVEIEIRDNGPGMDRGVLEHLFEPVTSTKIGHSGLGLTIVKNLVDQLHGEISCSSSHSGTRFQILLPRDSADGEEDLA
ncbi:MAG: HDOD domain-containing protein [Desulfuromonadaceae bacterium]|nr:HDOD domain-containing protein [Desulfuromonadaceae bacterium]